MNPRPRHGDGNGRKRLSSSFRKPSVLLLLLLFVLLFATTAAVTTTAVPLSLVELDCTPCIDRSSFRLTALLPNVIRGTSNNNNENNDERPRESLLRPLQQTARDLNVALDVIQINVFDNPTDEEAEIARLEQILTKQLVSSSSNTNNNNNNKDTLLLLRTDALIVTAPTPALATAIQNVLATSHPVPVFGWGWGYQTLASSQAVLGWLANDATATGRQAVQALQSMLIEKQQQEDKSGEGDQGDMLDGNENNTTITTVQTTDIRIERLALVHGNAGLSDPAMAIWSGILEEFQSTTTPDAAATNETDTDTARQVDALRATTEFPQAMRQNTCPYQAILVVDYPINQWTDDNFWSFLSSCPDMLVAIVLEDDENNAEVYRAITRQEIHLALHPQVHLQVTLAVLMAAVYVTIGKVVAMPIESNAYWSGPRLINARNVPSDTAAICEQSAFPVCSATSEDEVVTTTTNRLEQDEASAEDSVDALKTCPCTERREIRIGGVLHGHITDKFWDPVFASARQAAADMRIELDLERYPPQDDFSLIYEQMAARIRNLCDSGVDGLFVTIPDPVVEAAVQRCYDLRVPVVSVNSGQIASREMGLVHHVGQDEYSGGYGAAKRLIEAGMTRGCM